MSSTAVAAAAVAAEDARRTASLDGLSLADHSTAGCDDKTGRDVATNDAPAPLLRLSQGCTVSAVHCGIWDVVFSRRFSARVRLL